MLVYRNKSVAIFSYNVIIQNIELIKTVCISFINLEMYHKINLSHLSVLKFTIHIEFHKKCG